MSMQDKVDLSGEEMRAHLAHLLHEQKKRVSFSPASFAQRRLWFLAQLEPMSPVYNLTWAFSLSGSLHLTVLEQCFHEIVRRHDSLRTSFATVEQQVVQIVASSLPFTLARTSLEDIPVGERRARAEQMMQEEARRPFDLARSPLLRVTVLHLATEEHILLLVMHHIISDGWSLGVLLMELSQLYSAFVAEKPSPFPELPTQYPLFSLWQRQQLQGQRLDALLAYWKMQLAGAHTFLPLPADYSRPEVQTFRGATCFFSIDEFLAQGMHVLSYQQEVTHFMVLFTVFVALLFRYTNQSDIIVGTPIANRSYSEIEGLIGFFVNTLALRIDLSGNLTFLDLLQRVRATTIAAYAHQDLPFERLVEELQPERDVSYTPLFQVMFGLQNTPVSHLELAGVIVEPLEALDRGVAKFDLACSLEEHEHGLSGIIQYNTDLFEATTISRMVEHYITFLKSVVSRPDQQIAAVSFLTEHWQQKLLFEWNATEVSYPDQRCLHTAFEMQVERTPEGVAVVFEEEHLTYQTLNQRSNQLAHFLQKLGVLRANSVVGICIERSLEMVIGLLGILKAGGAYVPLDPTYPQERLAFMLQDAQVCVLITLQRLRDLLPVHNTLQNVYLDADWKKIALEHTTNVPGSGDLDTLAYVIYTSGSTGRPKGVMISHRGVTNRLLWGQETLCQLTGDDGVLQKTPFTFDISVWEFFWPLLNGARLVLAKPEGHRDGSYLIKVITEQNISVIHFVPAMLRSFLREPGLVACSCLKIVVCSGEPLPFDLQEALQTLLPVQLYNLYGPTEASIEVTCWACPRNVSVRTVPLGRPIANTSLSILDRNYQLVPVGVPGELYISGVQLAQGYWQQPDLTAERFLPEPFRRPGGSRMYRTGDLVRYLPDGNIEFLGRIDHQVKIRGFRIELEEIETVLRRSPDIHEAVVLMREDIQNDQRLVAYLVASQGGSLIPSHPGDPLSRERMSDALIDRVRQMLKKSLPEYMIPSYFILLDALPMTLTGKIDRRALPLLAHPLSARAKHEPPETESEQYVAAIWQEVLHLENVGIYDNFFDLGGHSLLMAQVYSQLRKRAPQLSMLDLFRRPTIHAISSYLSQDEEERPDPALERGLTLRERDRGMQRLQQRRAQKKRFVEDIKGI